MVIQYIVQYYYTIDFCMVIQYDHLQGSLGSPEAHVSFQIGSDF